MKTEILELVKNSPRLVAVHDKKNWVNLFSKDSVIADPIGTRPVSHQNLPKFYETFIAPNDIVFEEKIDIITDNQVARDVLIHTKLPGGLRVKVPAHLFYKVEKNKIQTMYAHWDLMAMVIQFLSKKGALKEMVGLSTRLMKNLGLLGALGFFKGMVWGIKGKGKKAVHKIFTKHDLRPFGPNTKIELPVEKKSITPKEFFNKGLDLDIGRITSAGWYTTFSFKADNKFGIGRLKFSPVNGKVTSAEIFLN
ncbi:MAG: hypothetical protein E2O68_05290 [Deltaproteobacteria bacterium]|nr:MAG: hypothetical protein E2O68_05290 [Deltaproteobacteria bacterium]